MIASLVFIVAIIALIIFLISKLLKSNSNAVVMTEKNKVASMLRTFSVIELICCVIISFVASGYYAVPLAFSSGYRTDWEFLHNPSVFGTWFGAGLSSWLILTAFAEIIQILHDIRNKQINN